MKVEDLRRARRTKYKRKEELAHLPPKYTLAVPTFDVPAPSKVKPTIRQHLRKSGYTNTR